MESSFLAANNGLEDIQYLIHLEAIKRFTEDNKNVQRNVEEHARNWLDAKCEYQSHYQRLVGIAKCTLLRNAADAQKSVSLDQAPPCIASDVKMLASKIDSDKEPTMLDQQTIEQCRIKLETGHRARSQLRKQQQNCADNHEALKSVHASVELVENGLEAAILQALDNPVSELPPRESGKNVDSS
ncbi:GL21391 [Drosophila persimilis]|uniref:GL21391 n=1 Tax=Drosophila persimilis TaxID=7234 RepID=B4HA96_DROPE|nr:augmin complex subunit dgt4 [Drosophila persimilis]EDW37490.1 GL21391 [Drosophila persimilis]